MDDRHTISLRVNATPTEVEVSEGETLLTTLRERASQRGVRTACGEGECGSCTVLVGDVPTASCITPTLSVIESEVTTPDSPDLDVVRRAFLDLQAAQCGYCINGIMLTVQSLVDRRVPATLPELRDALDRHLCRCGAHPRILEAACRALGLDGGAANDDQAAGRPWADELGSCRVVVVDGPDDEPAERLPDEVETSPTVDRWLRVTGEGTVQVLSGRSELGQGVHVALRQIVATQLGIDAERVTLRAATTTMSPDEGYTSGSRSMQQSGLSLAMAAVALRRELLRRAAAAFALSEDALSITGDGEVRSGTERVCSLQDLVGDDPIATAITLEDQPTWRHGALGAPVPRPDLIAKLSGEGAFVQDLQFTGMLHARVVLPPSYDAELEELDLTAVARMSGVRKVVRDGRLVLVIADEHTTATRAAAALASRARWGGGELAISPDAITTLRSLEVEPYVAREDAAVETRLSEGRRLRASYSKPYQAHAAVAPSGAVALADEGALTVWSQTQGVYPLQAELSVLLQQPVDSITVVQVPGPGCYGQNAADDAAGLAAIAARAVPGLPVRFQFSSSDEFAWEPYGSVMAADLEAAIDERGHIHAWRHRSVTDVHGARPRGQGDRLIASWLRADGVTRPRLGASGGGARNIEPIYDLPAVEAVADHVKGPLRTGSLRALGAFLNVFAIESFMDELAESAGQDPLEFRLAHLRDPRAQAVLETAAATVGWERRVGPSGRGRGLALARYSANKAYVAIVADVDVDLDEDRLRVERMTVVCDAGVIVNPEGLRQQLEGGVVHGISRTFHETVRANGDGVLSRSWTTYPVARFRDVPPMDIVLLDRAGSAPIGVGEASTPPTAPAIANAVDDAIGVRLRELPITPDRVREHLLTMDPAEDARVLG